MSEISQISARVDRLAAVFDRLASELEPYCHSGVIAGVVTAPKPDLTELEAAKNEAEAIKQELAGLRHRSKLDPEVRALENKLDEVLSRYYWLWQKCKEHDLTEADK